MNRAEQLARGTATGGVAVFLAAFSHGVAGGEAPGAIGLLIAMMVSLAASVAFVGRRSTPLRIALAVVVSQGAFHLLFGVGVATSGGAFIAGGSPHHPTLTFIEATSTTGAAAIHPDHAATAMLIGHAVAAALTIVYLLAVERFAWRALTATADRFVHALAGASEVEPIAIAGLARVRPVATTHLALRSRLRHTALGYRGPPRVLASA